MPFFKGLVLGLGTAFIFGPVFFTLFKNALQFGSRAGLWTALGIIVSDIAVILICFYGTAAVLETVKSAPVVKWIGAGILLLLGVRYILSPVSIPDHAAGIQHIHRRNHWGYFTQGLLVNGVNPFVFVVWIGFITIGRNQFSEYGLYIFLLGILIGVFTTDSLKALLANRIRPLLSDKRLKQISYALGIALIGFAIRLIIMAVDQVI